MTLTLKVNTLETIFSVFKPDVLLEIKSEINMKFYFPQITVWNILDIIRQDIRQRLASNLKYYMSFNDAGIEGMSYMWAADELATNTEK